MSLNKSYSSTEKNAALCRKELDFITNGNYTSNGYEECRNISYFKINGITRFWKQQQDFSISALVGDILNSCARYATPFVYAVIGKEDGVDLFIGTLKLLSESLRASYVSLFPGIDIEPVQENPLRTCPRKYGGILTGIPTDKTAENKGFQIENICRGMQGKCFSYIIIASCISNIAVSFGHEHILDEMQSVYSLINQTITGGVQGNLQAQKQDFITKNYFENLQALEQVLKNGMSRGMWRTNGYYAADNPNDSKQLGNIIKASFSGEQSRPEPFRVIEYHSIQDVISNTYMIADLVDNPNVHPVGCWTQPGIPKPIMMYVYKFQTILDSNQLSTLCQLPKQEFPGYYIDEYVEFDVSNRMKNALQDPVLLGDICVAGRTDHKVANNSYIFEKNDFTRHALIIGITGGGKTNTSKSLLNTLWAGSQGRRGTPFLVIESAKREYWELRNLKGFEDLLVFTLGAEATHTSVKYRINPFEANAGISLQTHIDYLLSTFKAAFDLYPPMPYILEKAVYEVYRDRGWDIVENTNRYGFTEYPTLSDLYHKIDVIVDSMGYHQEVQSNVKAALQARVYSLMIGGKGAMLNTPKSVPIAELLSRPVVMELEDLGDDETKSFVIGILLVQLYEYRKAQMTKGSKDLTHILMVEEAHRLLKNVSETGEGGNTRAKSVEFFCNLLAEIRTFGQGIIIADQIPTKLAPDTLKNTNLKIVHRTVALEDREAIGRAMNMTTEQIEYLSALKRGYAAVYAEGDNHPKCVKFPLVEAYYTKERAEVLSEVRKKICNIVQGYDVTVTHHAGCAFCEHRCFYYERISDYIEKRIAVDKVLDILSAKKFAAKSLVSFLASRPMEEIAFQNIFERICALGCVLAQKADCSEGLQRKYIADYLSCIYKIKL